MKFLVVVLMLVAVSIIGFSSGWQYNHVSEFLPNQSAWEANLKTQAKNISLLNGENADLSNELSGSKLRIERIDQSLQDAQDRYSHESAILNGQVGILVEQLESTNQDLMIERGKLATWFEITDVDSRLYDVAQLESEIVSLKEQRSALVPKRRTAPLACTGSMEPAISCKDVVTVITNPTPEDIVVGAVVTYWTESSEPMLYKFKGLDFLPTCYSWSCPDTSLGCRGELSNSLIMHRVIATRTFSGEKHYRMQGDANYTHDGCWVPFKNIIEYVVEINKEAACGSWLETGSNKGFYIRC